jgi:hypothetical protein
MHIRSSLFIGAFVRLTQRAMQGILNHLTLETRLCLLAFFDV